MTEAESQPTARGEQADHSGTSESPQSVMGGGCDEVLSLDYVFEILKNERRRRVLTYLQGREGEVTLSDLAEHIAALENETDVASISSSQRKRVYVGLYQCHLPKMDDMGVVAFDKNRGLVELGPNADQLYEYLDTEPSDGHSWSRYQLTGSVAGLVYSVLVVTGVITSIVIAALGFLAVCLWIGGCALAQWRAESGTGLTRQSLAE